MSRPARAPSPSVEAHVPTRRELREKRTLEAMVALYCREQHGDPEGPCPSCRELLSYAFERIANCPWGSAKPACADCAIHCYRSREREAIRERMRYAGPRMLWRHPWLALRHLLDKRRPSDLESLKDHRRRQRVQAV